MEFKFITADAKDLKRKRPQGACDACRRRKKRCFHGEDSDESVETSPAQATVPIPLFTPPTPLQRASGHATSTEVAEQPRHNPIVNGGQWHGPAPAEMRSTTFRPTSNYRSHRFMGDTHAEANLEIEQDDPSDKRDKDNVGIWPDDKVDEDSEFSQPDADHAVQPQQELILRDSDRRALITIFMARVQPLWPVLEAKYNDERNILSMPETLAFAVCLVASKDARAQPHLSICGSASPLPVNIFARKLYKIIVGRLRRWRDFDRHDLIRILTLIATHHEGADGVEESTLLLSQAVQHAFLLGIHLKRNQGNIVDPKTHEDTTRLFWCLWTLDKLCAAIGGRPRMAYETDVGLDFTESLQLFSTPGRLWMKLARLLSSVNDLYNPRPCVDTESHIKDFPRWEFLLEEEDVRSVDEGFLTTLELFYHSISMLSCRIKFLIGRKRAFASSLRRYLSATTVYSISRSVPAQDLAPLPVVPYAYCLATLVAYQQYRCSQRQIHRTIAHEKLSHFQEHLQVMAPCWYAAKSMSRKTQRVLREFHRASATSAKQNGEHRTDTSHVSTLSSSSITTPGSDLLNVQPHGNASHPFDTTAGSSNEMINGGAFADMDMLFGNLMDMNAFTGDIEFALDPNMGINGYDPAMWTGEGM